MKILIGAPVDSMKQFGLIDFFSDIYLILYVKCSKIAICNMLCSFYEITNQYYQLISILRSKENFCVTRTVALLTVAQRYCHLPYTNGNNILGLQEALTSLFYSDVDGINVLKLFRITDRVETKIFKEIERHFDILSCRRSCYQTVYISVIFLQCFLFIFLAFFSTKHPRTNTHRSTA